MSDEIDCFLSYAREDKALADRVFLQLRRSNIRAWMDKPPAPYDFEGIDFGEDWDKTLNAMIAKARFFVPLFTATGLEPGSYFQQELETALRIAADDPAKRTAIIPVLDGVAATPDVSAAGLSFNQFQWVDIESDGFNALLRHLHQRLADSGGETAMSGRLELEVATAAQLIDAIGPNRTIRLAPGDYNLTEVSQDAHEFGSVEPVHDGLQLVLHNLDDLVLVGDGDAPAHLFVEPRYAFPMYLSGCRNVRLQNLRLGHWPESGSCAGGVAKFERCRDVDLADCDLYGCGTVGLELDDVQHLVAASCTIRDCNTLLVSMRGSQDIVLHGCALRNNAVYSVGIGISNSRNITFTDTRICDNAVKGHDRDQARLITSQRSTGVTFRNCHIARNEFARMTDDSGFVEFLNCHVEE